MTADWAEQTQEMVNNWTEMQKKVWSVYFDSMNEMRKSPSEKLWDQTVSAGQQAIKNSFSAQQEFLSSWVNYIKGIEGVPEQVMESSDQYQKMSEQWLDTQQQLWANWFEMLKNFDFSKLTATWSGAGTDPMKMWQDGAQKIVEAQADWMRAWVNAFSAPGEEDEG